MKQTVSDCEQTLPCNFALDYNNPYYKFITDGLQKGWWKSSIVFSMC